MKFGTALNKLVRSKKTSKFTKILSDSDSSIEESAAFKQKSAFQRSFRRLTCCKTRKSSDSVSSSSSEESPLELQESPQFTTKTRSRSLRRPSKAAERRRCYSESSKARRQEKLENEEVEEVPAHLTNQLKLFTDREWEAALQMLPDFKNCTLVEVKRTCL